MSDGRNLRVILCLSLWKQSPVQHELVVDCGQVGRTGRKAKSVGPCRHCMVERTESGSVKENDETNTRTWTPLTHDLFHPITNPSVVLVI